MPRDLLALAAVHMLQWSGKERSRSKAATCQAWRAKEVRITALLLVLFWSSSALADTFGLGTAGPSNWAVLETGANQVSFANGTGITVNSGARASQANLGITQGGKLNQTGNVVIQGTYYKYSTNSDATTSGFTAVGGVNTTSNSVITSAASQASAASSNLAGLAANQTIAAAITTTTTITASAPGRNVVDLLAGINLPNGTTLTLSGSATQSFVINIPAGGIALGQASIVLTGGITAANVIFNLTGLTADNVSMTGPGVVNGIVMDLNGMVSLSNNDTVNGEVISGNQISLNNNSDVEAVQTVPEASTTAYYTLGPLSLVVVMLLYRRFSRRKQRFTRGPLDPVETVLDT
jgi:hypothetical protein